MQPFKNLDAAKAAGVQIKAFSQTETHRGVAWSCMVYFQGKKLGLVSNDGSGAMTVIDFGIDQQKQVMDALKAAGYELQLSIGDLVFDEPDTVDSWVEFAFEQLLEEAVELKGLKRKAKSHTYFEQLTAPCFAMYKAKDAPNTRAMLERQLGGNLVRFLNDTIQAY